MQWTTFAGDVTGHEDDDGSHFIADDPALLQVIAAFHTTLSMWVDRLWNRKRRFVFTVNQRRRVQQFIGMDWDSMYALDINWYILMIQAQFRRTRVRIGHDVHRKTGVGEYQKSMIARLSALKDEGAKSEDPEAQRSGSHVARSATKVRMEQLHKKSVRTDKPVVNENHRSTFLRENVVPSKSFLDTVGRMNLKKTNPEKDKFAGFAFKVAHDMRKGDETKTPDVLTALTPSPKTRRRAPTSTSEDAAVDRSRRAAAGQAELLANFFGGAVWGNFRENANCGDPPG